MEYVDFNDSSVPLGKRKVAYVKWAMSKGTEKIKAQRQANKKFGYENKCVSCGTVFNGYVLHRCPNCGES